MYTTSLRKVGGSVMLTVPPALLEVLQLQVGATVGLLIDQGKLIVEPFYRPAYRLEQLLAEYQVTPTDGETRDSLAADSWLTDGPVGKEEI